MSGIPFDYPLHPYTFQLVDYFIRGLEYTPRMEGTVHISKANGIQDIQQALGQMHLGIELTKASNAMMVVPPSPDRASVFSMCFPGEFTNNDLLMDPKYVTDGVTPHDSYINEMDKMGIDRILDAVP